MIQKRRHKRYPRRFESDFFSNNIKFKGFTSDFSLNGLFLRTTHPLTPATIIQIHVYLPDGSMAKVKGQVRRTARQSQKATAKPTQKAVTRPSQKVLGSKAKGKKPVKKNVTTVQSGMGIKILERDANYLHLIRSLVPR